METSHSGAKCILVVDDQDAVRNLIRQVLELDGYSVSDASDGLDGFRSFSERRFDLVITDFEMPRMTGDQLLDNIWRLRPGQKVIVVSSNADKLGERLCRVNRCLSKPFLISELRAAVKEILQGGQPA